MRRSAILNFLGRQGSGSAGPDPNPWVEAVARTLTGIVGWFLIMFALGVGGVSGDALATYWHGPANTVWPIYASIGGIIGAGLAAQAMFYMLLLTDRQRIYFVVLLLGLIPGVGLVVMIFAATNWFFTRTLDRRDQRNADRDRETNAAGSVHDTDRT